MSNRLERRLLVAVILGALALGYAIGFVHCEIQTPLVERKK